MRQRLVPLARPLDGALGDGAEQDKLLPARPSDGERVHPGVGSSGDQLNGAAGSDSPRMASSIS